MLQDEHNHDERHNALPTAIELPQDKLAASKTTEGMSSTYSFGCDARNADFDLDLDLDLSPRRP